MTKNLTLRDKITLGKRKRRADDIDYMNCSFILGSTAEAERLWSSAKNILNGNQKGTTPLVFESILLLNANKGYWNECTVKEAMDEVASERGSLPVEEDAATANIERL